MNKKGLVILLLIVVGVFGYKWFFKTDIYSEGLVPAEDAALALQEVWQKGKPIFLEFTSESCPACRNAQPWIEEMYQNYQDEVIFILADVNKGGQSLAQNFGVLSVPTFIYFDKDGNVVHAFAGYPATQGKEYLEEKLKTILQ